MADVKGAVLLFAAQAERAAAYAQEALALSSGAKGHAAGRGHVQVGCTQLKMKKAEVLAKWLKAVKGTVQRPTLFGTDAVAQSNFSDLFDAIIATLESPSVPPNHAELVSFCARLMPLSPVADVQVQDSIQAMLLFEEAANNVLHDCMAEPSSVSDTRIDLIIQRVLLIAEDCLKTAFARSRREVPYEVGMVLAEARTVFGEARDTLLDAMDQLRALVPKAIPLKGLEDVAAIKQLTESAQEVERVAARLQLLLGEAAKAAEMTQTATDSKEYDIRVALVSFLRQRHDDLSDLWLSRIVQRVDGYRPESGEEYGPSGTASVSREINRRLVAAMIERMRPGGDGAALVYAAQNLVEKRYERMNIHAVQAATKLFEDVCMELCQDLAHKGPYSRDFLPLISCDGTEIRSILTDVIFLANKLIISEYNIRAARGQDPRLPSSLLRLNSLRMSSLPLVERIPELLVGAEIGGQYRLDTYIMAGTFGYGWKATDLQTNHEVFVKVFKPQEEFGLGMEAVVAKMVEELETAERICKVKRLMQHPNVVAVLKVPRNATIVVPATLQQGDGFHGIITEFCDGGELFNYLVLPCDDGGLMGCEFTELQARFLFKQIVHLLLALHHPAEGEGEPYYHGDLKDQNLVLAGATLKLIDYGTLSKVSDNAGPVRHMTPTHAQPFHTTCEAVDLWAAGIILLDMLVIRSIGQVFQMNGRVNYGVALLKANQFWDQIEMVLRQKKPNHCLLQKGPDTARDLLQQIFVMRPTNSLSVKCIAEHPWLQGPVPSVQEMEVELHKRYKGILGGAPSGTSFFDLGPDVTLGPKADELMQAVIELACRDSKGEFVKGGPGKAPGMVYIHRWDPSSTGGQAGAELDRIYDQQAQWVVAKYLCSTEQSDFNIAKGRRITRIRLFWENGSAPENFFHLSGLMLHAVMKLRP
eukprot:GGOE01037377.1.p1 GENE.GGOE01037377.1~~GGOE01037377.1.p1  ORF type:complete len:938 (-),score=288.75 GGOE01037377.1:294-3074(-)